MKHKAIAALFFAAVMTNGATIAVAANNQGQSGTPGAMAASMQKHMQGDMDGGGMMSERSATNMQGAMQGSAGGGAMGNSMMGGAMGNDMMGGAPAMGPSGSGMSRMMQGGMCPAMMGGMMNGGAGANGGHGSWGAGMMPSHQSPRAATMIPRLPAGNEKLQLQMQAELMQKMGEILAKYADKVRVSPEAVR